MTTAIDTTSESTTTPQVAVNDIGSAEDFLAAIDETIKYFNDGDIVGLSTSGDPGSRRALPSHCPPGVTNPYDHRYRHHFRINHHTAGCGCHMGW